MKISITVITIIAIVLFFECPAEAQHIPDNNFAKGIRHYCPECIDSNDNLLPPAKSLIELRACMDDIKDVTGIEGFSGLQVLALNLDKISTLPNLPPNLIDLDVSFNEYLTTLPQLPVSLKKLDIQHTAVGELPTNLPPQLEYLRCSRIPLKILPDLPGSLVELYIDETQIRELPSNLPPELKYLNCSHTPIKILPNLPGSLRDLYINETEITSISQLPDQLNSLCYDDKYIHCIPCKNVNLYVTDPKTYKLIKPVFCSQDNNLMKKKTAGQITNEVKKCISGNCKNGTGKLEIDYSEGHSSYSGSFKNEFYHGQGTLVVKDKYKYTGSFKDGKMDGKGTFTSLDSGFVCTGEFKNDNMEGTGTYTYKDGKKSIGTWKGNRLWAGKGYLKLGDNESYYGEVKENKPDGQGVRNYANGKKFTGTFSKGSPMTGNGYYLSEREKANYEGDLKNGEPDGYGEMAEFDGWLYKGNWTKGKRNGQGDYYNNGKLFYSGLWTNGAHGKDPGRAPEKTVPKVYFFNSSYFWDDGKSVEEQAEQPVNEFYRTLPGLTAVIYLPKGLHPEKYWDDVKLHYIFVVYADQYDSKDEKKVATYTVIAEPRQRKIWKYLPLGDLDGQKFTVRVYEGDFTIYESVNPSGKLLGEGKVNRTQTR